MNSSHLVLARVYEHIEPIARGDRYEDPLQAVLEKADAGRVTGGGSQLNEHGGIAYADLELELANIDDALRIVAEALEELGAPQGSELILPSQDRVLREFGRQQCVAVFLDGIGLPDDVYANLDFDAMVGELGRAAGDNSFRGTWQGSQETGLFFFGLDAEAMFSRMEGVLQRLPIGQNARVVVRHGKQSFEPREVRMPMHSGGAA
jgi:hypothetical protein